MKKTNEVLKVERANFEKIDAQVMKIQQEKAEIEAHNLEKASVIQKFEVSFSAFYVLSLLH